MKVYFVVPTSEEYDKFLQGEAVVRFPVNYKQGILIGIYATAVTFLVSNGSEQVKLNEPKIKK